MGGLGELLLGPALVATLFVSWLAVQALWRRVFGWAAQTDVLAGRPGCAGCSRAGACAGMCEKDKQEQSDGS